MRQLSRMITAFVAVALFAGVTEWTSADDKEPSIKEIMTKAHKGGDSILAKIGKDLKADKPDWDDVAKLSKELEGLGTSLGKAKPPKGDEKSWEKLTKEYQDNAKALVAAADKKELKDAKAAHMKLAGSCKDCHSVHKGK